VQMPNGPLHKIHAAIQVEGSVQGDSMLKSALAALLVSLPGVAMAEDWSNFYVKIYGGGTAEDALFAGVQEWDLQQGSLMGAALGIATPVPGLSLELDVTSSAANYVGDQNALLATLVTANAVYSIPVSANFSLYGGAGLGYAYVLDECIDFDAWDADGTAIGGQVFIGADMMIADRVSVFAEFRHQAALGRVEVEDQSDIFGVDYRRNTILAGLKISL
jgi:opacity protein-like surface antigen